MKHPSEAIKKIEHRRHIKLLSKSTEEKTIILQIFKIINPPIPCFFTAFQPTVFVHTLQM
ncbi:MAG: hypothetical protein EGP78_12410 [Alistipes shahii]|nr:hypothetical protein [Alistipes shahii]